MILNDSNSDIFMEAPPPRPPATIVNGKQQQQQGNGCSNGNDTSNSSTATTTSTTTSTTNQNSKATFSGLSTMTTTRHNQHSFLSHSLHDNLLEKHHKVDPMEFYTIEAVLGEGSMGFVAKVVKNDSVLGGSARPEFVKKHHHADKVCFCFPVLSWTIFCPPDDERIPNMNGTFINVPASSSTGSQSTYNDNVASFLTSSDISVGLPNNTITNQNPKILSNQHSSMISYHKRVKAHYALKSIILDRCSTPELKDELKNEVEILKSLDHPNIVRAFETFDYRGRLYIVMELCGGKDLYSRDPYTEAQAKRIMTSLLEAVSYLHSKGIVHRDLKYENIMFIDESPDAEIRLIDFGLSQKFATGEHLHAFVGTVYTMAPELINGDYDAKADIWSLGVIAFMLLSSSMPFFGESRGAVIDQILHGKYKFQSKRWQQVSTEAKDFVMSLLRRRPEKRPSAQDALHTSAWLAPADDLEASTNTMAELDRMDTIQASIQAFAKYPTLKKLALLVVAYKSTSDEIGFLRKMFSKFDTSNDGEITYEEFRTALLENYDYTESEMESMFAGMDIDGMGKVHYMEFLAATIEAHGSIDEERLAESFDRIDTDDSGVITVKNLKDFLGDELSDTYLEGLLTEAHADYSTVPAITYDEFLHLWDFNHDGDIMATKQSVVSAHRRHGIEHTLSSTLSTVSSTISDDTDDGHVQETNVPSKTGCVVFDIERRKSEEKLAPLLFGDV